MRKSIKVENRLIGDSEAPFVVAEVGINHNGDINLAKRCIVAAAEAGADAVKFQNYRTENFVSDRSLRFKYWSQGRWVEEPQFDMFKRFELDRDQLFELKKVADNQGLVFHSTPTSLQGIQDLTSIGCSILKNGSDYLTHLELVRAMGETGLVTVLSTGMSTLAEIDEAVRTFRETGNENLILLHCTSSYPTPAKDVNLARLPVLADAFDLLVGLSDHTAGNTAAIGSTFLGSVWIEKHFTLDRELPGPDHWFSMNPTELGLLVNEVHSAKYMLGSPHIQPTESESFGREDFRISCVAAHDLSEGHLLSEEDIAYRRPGTGIPPNQSFHLVGRTLLHSVERGHLFTNNDFK